MQVQYSGSTIVEYRRTLEIERSVRISILKWHQITSTLGVVDISTRWTTQMMLVHITSSSPIVFTCCFLMQRRILLFLNENKVLQHNDKYQYIFQFGLSASSLLIHRMVMKVKNLDCVLRKFSHSRLSDHN